MDIGFSLNPCPRKLGAVQLDPLTPTDQQIARLRILQPTILWTYPSVLMAILDEVDELSSVCRPRAIITTAEVVPNALGRQLAAYDGLECFNWYGSSEGALVAWECQAHEGLHLFENRVLLEVVPVTGEREGNGKVGEAVITVLDAYAMPFIRYRLGDLVRFLDRRCTCGRASRLIAPPLGRCWDVVRLPSGTSISSHRFSAALRPLEEIRQFRIIQTDDSGFVVVAVCREPASEGLAARIQKVVRDALGEPVHIEVRLVDRIQTNPGSKFRVVVSELPRQAARSRRRGSSSLRKVGPPSTSGPARSSSRVSPSSSVSRT